MNIVSRGSVVFLASLLIPSMVNPALAQAAPRANDEIVIDTIAASVNGKPITLKDISDRLPFSEPLSRAALSENPQARDMLERLIFERLIQEEAASRNLRVTDSDINSYIEEVARKNNMSRAQFEQALALRHQKPEQFREQASVDILRSRLISQIMQQGAAVTREDIDQYLSDHPALTRAGSKVKLGQIVISSARHSGEEARSRAEDAETQLREGAAFAEVAAKFSDATAPAEGNSLGVVAEEELSPQVFEALLSVKEGGFSAPVQMADGFHIFQVEKRFLEKEKEADETVVAEVRKILSEQKLQERLQTFFSSDLMKAHTVDRKL